MKMLKNKNTGEERPLIRCGITRCDKVIHIGDAMGYNKNYDVFCEECSGDLFVARGEANDDWISGDPGWEEVDVEEEQCLKCNQLFFTCDTPMKETIAISTGDDTWEERLLCIKCYIKENK